MTKFFFGLKEYLIFGISRFTSSGISSIFWIYLASVLEKEDYGMLGLFLSIATIGKAVSSLGLHRTIVVYGTKDENIISPAYILGLGSSAITAIVVYLLTQNITISFLIMGLIIFALNEAYLTSKKKYAEVAKEKILHNILIIVFALILYQFFGITGIILGYALANLPALRLIFIIKNKKIDFSILRSNFGFMAINWVTAIFTTLFIWGDKIIIGSLFGLSILANFHLAIQYFIMLNNLPHAVMGYLLPQAAQGTKNKKVKIVSIAAAILLVVVSIAIVPYIIGNFFPAYHESILPIIIVSFGIIPATISSIHESEFVGKGNNRMVMYGVILGVISYFSLLVILGSYFGLIGMAVAFLVSSTIRAVFNIILEKRYKHTDS